MNPLSVMHTLHESVCETGYGFPTMMYHNCHENYKCIQNRNLSKECILNFFINKLDIWFAWPYYLLYWLERGCCWKDFCSNYLSLYLYPMAQTGSPLWLISLWPAKRFPLKLKFKKKIHDSKTGNVSLIRLKSILLLSTACTVQLKKTISGN